MSDFLTSLAARTLGTAPGVIPRRLSRFEPEMAHGAEVGMEADLALNSSAPSAAVDSPGPTPRARVAPVRPAAGEMRRDHASVNPTMSPPKSIRDRDAVLARAEESPTADPTRTGQESSARADLGAAKPTARPASDPRISPILASRGPRTANVSAPPIDRSPAIHVTIGRVEVRAIHRADSAPAPRTTPAEPRLSLTSYLRNHNG